MRTDHQQSQVLMCTSNNVVVNELTKRIYRTTIKHSQTKNAIVIRVHSIRFERDSIDVRCRQQISDYQSSNSWKHVKNLLELEIASMIYCENASQGVLFRRSLLKFLKRQALLDVPPSFSKYFLEEILKWFFGALSSFSNYFLKRIFNFKAVLGARLKVSFDFL